MSFLATFIVALHFLADHVTGNCIFPLELQVNKNWQFNINITSSIRTKVLFTESALTFIKQTIPGERELETKVYQCIEVVDIRKFIFIEKINGVKDRYKCMEIIERSKSVMQLRESDSSYERSNALCDRQNMSLNPWLLVSYQTMKDDYTPCPVSAGYNMKITDSRGEPNGCNFMHLPMRFESDCIAGEGMIFDFQKHVCTNFKDDNFSPHIVEKTICVTHWAHGNYLFSVIRQESGSIWCLRFPRRFKSLDNLQVQIFIDGICPAKSVEKSSLTFYTMHLEKKRQSEICADEYPECSTQPCVGDILNQCHKSCGKCDPNDPLPICSFPRDFRGGWILQNSKGTKSTSVNITASQIRIGSFGKFKCIVFNDESPGEMYTTVSTFRNGCRPRYSCLDLKRIGQSLLGITVSQSYIWPLNMKNPSEEICDTYRFKPDPSPIGDMYRGFVNSLKPIFPLSKNIVAIPCNMDTTYRFHVRILEKWSCQGRMYQDCSNSSLLRMDFENCRSHPRHIEFICVASISGRYWEKLILLQNRHDKYHSRCLGFTTLKETEAIMLSSSQCDVNSWSYVEAGIRQPLMHFTITDEKKKCDDIPVPTTLPTTTTVKIIPEAQQDNSKFPEDPSLMRDGKVLESEITPPYRIGEDRKTTPIPIDYDEDDLKKDSVKVDSGQASVFINHSNNYIFLINLVTVFYISNVVLWNL